MSSSRFEDFRSRFNEVARASLASDMLTPQLRLDAEISLGDLSYSVLKQIEALEPAGQGNPRVQVATRGLRIKGAPRQLGENAQHLRFSVTDGHVSHQAVWWNCEQIEFPASFDLAFAPELNQFNGTYGIQLRVLDLRASTVSSL